MAKLVYSAIASLDGHVADQTANSTRPSGTRRCIPPSTTSSARLATNSTAG